MPKMDLSVVAAYGDDIWNSKSDVEMEYNKDEAAETSIDKPRSKKRRSGQDRVVSAQIYLAIVAVVLIVAVKFLFPNLYQTLYTQYTEFIAETPVWDLDGIVDVFRPA